MKDKAKKWLPVVAISIFTLLIWPWSEKEAENSRKSDTALVAKETQPKHRTERENKSAFQSKPLPESLKKKEAEKEKFRVTNPKAIEYNEQADLVMSQGPGKTPAITDEDFQKPTIQSAIEAKNNPEKYASRLSPLHKASKFDKEKFLKNKSYRLSYVNNPEPSRVWQEDPNSSYKMKRISNAYLEAYQNEPIEIQVQGAPSMPINALSTDLGVFQESGLTHATVIADKNGYATFTFIAPDGTFGDNNIVVGGAAMKGMVKFKINTLIKPVSAKQSKSN